MPAIKRLLATLFIVLLLAGSLAAPAAGAQDLPPYPEVSGGAGHPPVNGWAPVSAGPTFAQLMLKTSPVNNTHNASVAVDAQGGTHVAFAAYTTNGDGNRPAYYAYCASRCDDYTRWTIISLGGLQFFGDYASLALSPAGLPRIVWYRDTSNLSGSQGQYQYVECNGECTNPANWSQPLSITSLSSGSAPWDVHYFALDPQGRPRLVYTDTPAGHSGTFYLSCEAGCTSRANWHELKITANLWSGADLVFDGAGRPRIAFILTDAQYKNWVTFVECNQACASVPANWQGTTFYQVGAGRAYSLRIDGNGRARLAAYSGFIEAGNPINDLLSYWGCDANCGTYTSWHGVYLGLPAGQGEQVDLVLDSGNRPHLAYLADDVANSVYGLGYAFCNGDQCESGGATWETRLVERPEDVDLADPVPSQPGCKGMWLNVGKYPSIAVDGLGIPRVGYTVEHYQGVTCAIHEDLRLVRFAVAISGVIPPNLPPRAYVPLLKVKR